MDLSVTGVLPDQEARALSKAIWAPWLIVALTPAALALVSWDTVGVYEPVQAWLRLFGIAAVVAELAVVVYSILAGAEPLRALASLPPWATVALIVLFATGFGTALFVAADGLRAIQWTFYSLVHLLFGLAVAALVRVSRRPNLLAIWNAVLAGSLGFLLILMIFVVIALQRGTLNWEYFGLGGTNIRHVGFYAVVGAGAALGLAIIQASRRISFAYVACSTLMLALAFWSGTRGALLAIIVAFVVGATMLPVLRKLKSWVMLGASLVGGALLSLAGPTPNSLYGIVRLRASTSSSSPDVSSGRFDMWAGAWQAIQARPLIGYGAGQYYLVVPDKLGGFNHPHNIFLQLLLHWGAVGAACYFALATLVARKAYLTLRTPQPSDAPALIVLAALLTTSLYDGGLFNTYPTMMIAFALALIVASPRASASSAA